MKTLNYIMIFLLISAAIFATVYKADKTTIYFCILFAQMLYLENKLIDINNKLK